MSEALTQAERDELRAWVSLLALDGLGNETYRVLLKAFGSALGVLHAPTPAIAQASKRTIAEAVSSLRCALEASATPRTSGFAAGVVPNPQVAAVLAHETLAWLEASDATSARHLLTLGDPRYPADLLQAPDPPNLLYAIGDVSVLKRPSLAVVGSRNATAQGIDNARQFSSALSAAGVTIVSGMALGIDAAAHEGGLSGSGSTIAVVGTGLDRVYPARHRELAHRIASHGLILSEFPLGTPPLANNFPKRNRIIAGLSRGTLVVEAAMGSGSLITARLATECSRDVFAIPGSIHSPQARGCHWLIKQGAKLVDQAQDVLDELSLAYTPALTPEARDSHGTSHLELAELGDRTSLLAALGFEPTTMDVLAARTGLDAAQLSAALLELELAGQVARMPGGLFQRTALA